MKNLSQLSTRFFPDSSGLPQNDPDISGGLFTKPSLLNSSTKNHYQVEFRTINSVFNTSFLGIKFSPDLICSINSIAALLPTS